VTEESPAVEGPYFDELAIDREFGGAPGVTLTPGLAAAHQAITGDRLALALDHELCQYVVTQHVKANLFYRGLAFRRARLAARSAPQTGASFTLISNCFF
jgi:acyl dehydratase